jgi:hypothetical protein
MHAWQNEGAADSRYRTASTHVRPSAVQQRLTYACISECEITCSLHAPRSADDGS